MEPSREDLLSALKEAEQFISVTLSNEGLSGEAERRRHKLKVQLESLTEHESKPPLPLPRQAPDGSQDVEEEELYDDVQQGNQVAEPTVTTTMNIKGVTVPNESDDHEQLNYEDMQTDNIQKEESEDFYDDTVPENSKNVPLPINEDLYDDTVPENSKNLPSTNEVEITEDTEYEVAETQNQTPNDTNENQDDDFYEGVEIPNEDNKSLDSLETQEKSATQQLESLTKPIKPEDVEDVVFKGYLDKHRKKGLYIGSKWQKRYCIVRSFALYYYSGPTSTAQKGTIILPGYKATNHKNGRSNGKEFILTRDQDRSFIFMAETKESAERWIDAITKAANASEISKRQSEIIDSLRSSSGDDEDTSSLCYDDDKDSINNVPITTPAENEELYDDVNQGEAEKVSANSEEVDYEIPGAKDAQENDSPELYEAPAEETQPEPPSRYPKPQPIPPPDEEYEMPEIQNNTEMTSTQPPPEPERLNPPSEDIPTVSEEEEEIYDDIVQPIPEPARPAVESKPPIPERNRPLSHDSKPSPPLTPRVAGKIPLPPTPPKAEPPKPTIPPRPGPPPKEEAESETPIANHLPPPPPPPSPEHTLESESPLPSPPPEDKIEHKAPPPPPLLEEKTEEQVIDYSSIYQALWDCKPDADDELQFNRGDLIYIYEKPHSDWWIGSKYKPQGYETRLIPRNYLTEAYNM